MPQIWILDVGYETREGSEAEEQHDDKTLYKPLSS